MIERSDQRWLWLIITVISFVLGVSIGILLSQRFFSPIYPVGEPNALSTASEHLLLPVDEPTETGDEVVGDAVKGYARPVDQDLIDFFGSPLQLNKSKYIYRASPNSDFLRGELSVEDYFFGPSITGAVIYFTNASQEKKYRELRASPKEVEKVITDILGIGVIDLGNIDSIKTEVVEQQNELEIRYYKLFFSSGAVAQFYVMAPVRESARRKIMVALHGCSSSPDKVLGLTAPDYTNSFGVEAVKQGWVVIAPYIISNCDYIDDFDALGALSSGSTLYGYEIQKIQAVVDYILADKQVDQIDLYGISLGGRLAMWLAALDTRYKNLVVSGSILDYRRYYQRYLLENQGKSSRVGNSLSLYRYLNTEDLLLDFLEDGGHKLVIEVGAYDIMQDRLKRDNRDIITVFLANCRQKFADCDKRIFINFFQGYHETNSLPSVEFIGLP
jgi:pimeloyl-ACP methyl ester carboxylesterase